MENLSASDLRIGNLVWNPNLNENRILDILDIRDFFERRLVMQFEPIPLTEEWLLKFGFVREKNIIKIYTKDKISIYWDCNEYPKGRVYFNSWCILKEKIQYVHTLQNLIHALTNEELTYDIN